MRHRHYPAGARLYFPDQGQHEEQQFMIATPARRLSGKCAIVTGSTSGIGLGIAAALAAEGCNIMLNGFGDKTEIARIQGDLTSRYRVETAYSAADMSKPAAIRQMVRDAAKTFGGVDILVNNAGIQFVAPIEAFPDDRWDSIIAINLSAAFHAIKAAAPEMKARRYGRVVNIASAHGLVGSDGKAAYVAAKHGLVGLTKVVALDLANHGITCNAICPGWVLTPLVEKQIEYQAKQDGISVEKAKENLLKEKQPIWQFSTPEHLGALTVFLCSEAGATMTGTALPMDGGRTAH
jgi:3-hydroxybutyrate dehydrogenase